MNFKQFNHQVVSDYNKVFGTRLCPESKYPISTLSTMKKKLRERGVYGYFTKY